MRFVTIGECMMELRQADDGRLTPGFAGDALNSAFYARRTLPSTWTIEFLTAFGIDRVSQQMRASIAAMGIETSGSATIPDRQAGLYMIHLDKGERSFSYWRSQSAARLHDSGQAGKPSFSTGARAEDLTIRRLVQSLLTRRLLADSGESSLVSAGVCLRL